MTSLFARIFRPFTTSTMAATPAVIPEGAEVATLAAGCFWGVEHLYVKNFGHGKGLLDTRVGYIGGATDSPTYKIVCSGATGRK